jgi:hypothetical protein
LIAKLENAPMNQQLIRAVTDKSQVHENWEGIKKVARTCEQIMVTGGEPLLMPGTEALINFLVDENPSATLNFTTNCTTYKSEVFEKLNMLNYVGISLSLDSVGDNLEYIRWPSKHNKIVSNVKEFIKYENIHFDVVPIFYINNLFYLRDILDFWANFIEETGYTKLKIMPSLISDRDYYKLDILPNIYKTALLAELGDITNHRIFDMSKFQPKDDGHLLNFKKLIDDVDTFAHSNLENTLTFDKYLEETARYDVLTNTKMEVGNKKLFDCLSNKHRDLLLKARAKYQSLKIST